MNYLSQLAIYYSNYDNDYSYTSSAAATLAPGVIMLFVLIGFIIFAALYALHAFLLSRIFKKAGLASWIAWVPFYSTWKLLELGGQPGFWAVLAIISPLNIVTAVFVYISMYHIGLKFGKDGAWIVLGIFLPTVWMAILAFDSSKWDAKPVKK
jgi:hypothetical protein